MKDIRAAAVQFNHYPGDKPANLQIIEDFVIRAAEKDVQLIVFPEMCITGYWHVRKLNKQQIKLLAEGITDGSSTRFLLSLSQKYEIIIGAGLIEKSAQGKFYNSYMVAMPDGQYVCHRKLHSFISEHIESGDQYTVFDTELACRMGVLTCWDNNLVENVRITALRGAEILIAPHQTGGCHSSSPEAMGLIDPQIWHNRFSDPDRLLKEVMGPKGRGWLMRWLPARAHDNGMFLIFSNGIGLDDDEVRTGNAMILDPYGRILVESNKADNDMVIADLEAAQLDMCTGQRWLRGRRPELYHDLVRSTGKQVNMRQVRFSEKS